jgi:hypothetical protein
MQPVSKQRLNKYVPANKQQWEMCSLWAMLQRVAMLHNNSDNRGERVLGDTYSEILVCFSFGARAPIWALAYLHETLRFTSVTRS